jgi:hypothetical protein
MSSGSVDDRVTLIGEIATMTATIGAVVDLPIDTPTHNELLTVLDGLESALWRVPAAAHQIAARLEAEVSPVELGATSMAGAGVGAGRDREPKRGAGSRMHSTSAHAGHRRVSRWHRHSPMPRLRRPVG